MRSVLMILMMGFWALPALSEDVQPLSPEVPRDDSLWMETKPINGRPVFVRLFALSGSGRKKSRENLVAVFVETKPGDPRVRCSDVVVSAKDQRGESVELQLPGYANRKGFYSRASGQPDHEEYIAKLENGRPIASISVKWKGRRQTLLGSGRKKVGDVYTIAVPDEVSLENITVYYSFDGQPGGYLTDGKRIGDIQTIRRVGGYTDKVPRADKVNILSIPIEHGKSLEAVIFCPGYQTATIYEPSLASAKHEASVEMKALPMLHLSGKIDPYEPVANDDLVVIFSYNARLGLHHLTFVDGVDPVFKVATVPLSPDNSFSVEIPDFYHDPAFQEIREKELSGVWQTLLSNSEMTVTVRNRKTGNTLFRLSPNPKDIFGSFPIQQSYPDVVTFYASMARFKEANGQ